MMPALCDLIQLLKKITASMDHVQVEANYDGREWKWKLYQPNVTASEWTPREERSEQIANK